MKKKVYIVDYELISPISMGRDFLFENLAKNTSADRIIKKFSTEGLPFQKAAEVQEDLKVLYKNELQIIKEVCAYDRKFELLVSCYGLWTQKHHATTESISTARKGVIMGVGADVIPFECFENEFKTYLNKKLNPFNELISVLNKDCKGINMINNSYDIYSLYLAEKFNAHEFQQTILTACVSSTQALSFGYDAIVDDQCDVVIAGGTDSLINILALISFGKLGVISDSTDQATCKPFDVRRNGALAGECAGFAILASEEFMIKNKLIPIAQFVGYGNTMDAYKITAPDPEGSSISRAIKDAVNNSGISVEMIDYINAHGTGTIQNDALELKCLQKALGEKVKQIPISSTKDRHGHAIAAAGIQELCVLLECLKNNFVPGTLNLSSSCDNSFNTVSQNSNKKINYGLTSNFAFGGINTVIAIKNES